MPDGINNPNTPTGQESSGFAEPAPGTIPRSTIKIGEALEADHGPSSATTGTVRTFQSDIAHAVKNDNVSAIKIAMAEKNRREQDTHYANFAKPRRSHGALVAIIITLILVGGGVAGVYFYTNKPLPPTIAETIAPNEPELLYSEEQALVDSNGKSSDKITAEIRGELLKDLEFGVIKRVLLSKGTASSTKNTTTSEFLTLIRSGVPDGLRSAFAPQYFLGGYSKGPHETFIIIKIASYESAYAGMLAWEPHMEKDLGKFFPSSMISIATTSPASPTSTTTASSTQIGQAGTSTLASSPASSTSADIFSPPEIPAVATFKDRIIQNKDTRMLVGTDGRNKFLYTFLDKNTLLIASSERALQEVQARLTTGRIRR